MAQILEIFQDVIESNGSKSLDIDSKGNLISKDISFFESYWELFGFHDKNKVIDFIDTHKEELLKESEVYFKEGKSLTKIQDLLDSTYQGSKIADKPDVIAHIFSNWMSYLSDDQKQSSIRDIVLPGTHDSAAYKIDWKNPINDDKNPLLNNISYFLKYTIGINKLVENWTVTQNESIEQQLNHGVRMLDLRVSYDNTTNKFILSHSFAIGELEPVLEQIGNFLNEHPSEFLTIGITRDWEHKGTIVGHEQELNDLLDKYISSHSTKDLDITYQNAIQTGKNSFIYTDMNLDRTKYLSVYNDVHTNGSWKDKYTVETSLDNLDNSLNNFQKSLGNLETMSFTVTPNLYTIMHNLSLHNVTNELNNYFASFIDSHNDSVLNMSGINMDFPTYAMIEKIIHLNIR